MNAKPTPLRLLRPGERTSFWRPCFFYRDPTKLLLQPTICTHLHPSASLRRVASNSACLASQTNRTTKFFRLPVNCAWQTCSRSGQYSREGPSQESDHRRTDSPSRSAAKPIRIPTTHILWRRFARLLLVNGAPNGTSKELMKATQWQKLN
jgi:hypothetical protein